jgi:Zn-dependent protease with chaperone function
VKLDRANRSFVAILAITLGAYLVLGAASCGILAILAYRVSVHGIAALTSGPHPLWPAALLLLFVGTGTVLGVLSLRKQLLATEALDQHVRSLRRTLPEEVYQAAKRNGLRGRVRMVDEEAPFSFAYGLLKPKVVVSSGLVESVSAEELDAVLAHERYHVRNYDPLKVVVVRTLPSAFFFLPVLRELRTRYLAARELEADRRSLERHGRAPLAGALYKVVEGTGLAELGPAAALGGPDFLDARVSQIESGAEPERPSVSWRSWTLTALGGAGLVLAVVLTGVRDSFSMMGSMDSGHSMMGAGSMPLAVLGTAFSVLFWAWAAWEVVRVVARRRRHLGADLTTTNP